MNRKKIWKLWDLMPEVTGCQACGKCCNEGVTIVKAEISIIEGFCRRLGISIGMSPDGRTCPALGEDGRCRIYEVRPTGCRLYGQVQHLECGRTTPPKWEPGVARAIHAYVNYAQSCNYAFVLGYTQDQFDQCKLNSDLGKMMLAAHGQLRQRKVKTITIGEEHVKNNS
jgi:Fe-S-cluster containining protein